MEVLWVAAVCCAAEGCRRLKRHVLDLHLQHQVWVPFAIYDWPTQHAAIWYTWCIDTYTDQVSSTEVRTAVGLDDMAGGWEEHVTQGCGHYMQRHHCATLTHFPNHNFITRRAPTLIMLLQCTKVGLQRVLGLHLEGVSFIGIDSVVFVLQTTISMQSRKMNNSQQHIVATDQQQETQCKHCWDVTANAVLNGIWCLCCCITALSCAQLSFARSY